MKREERAMAMENLGGLGFGCGFLNFFGCVVTAMSPVVGLVFSPLIPSVNIGAHSAASRRKQYGYFFLLYLRPNLFKGT
jgi:hypothetical protein